MKSRNRINRIINQAINRTLNENFLGENNAIQQQPGQNMGNNGNYGAAWHQQGAQSPNSKTVQQIEQYLSKIQELVLQLQ